MKTEQTLKDHWLA